MEMTMRWFGTGYDSVTLEQIRQVPGVQGVVATLYGTKPGEIWSVEAIRSMKKQVEDCGLRVSGIESVNIHDAIKAGTPERDKYIQNYITTLDHLGQEGIRLVCYNFMPVFDWTRSDLAKRNTDGSTTMSYDQEMIDRINPDEAFESINRNSNGFVMPGWEPERMTEIKKLFELYRNVGEETLFANLKYFLEAIMPVCEKYDIKMAIHPDDPAWPVFGLARIMTNKKNLLRLIHMVDHPCNGITLCTGSLGSNPQNDIPDMIYALEGHIYFAHVRNLKHNGPGRFEETAHLSSCGSIDMYEVMKALYETGFNGVIRPDHGRAIWGEVSMPGYGLYDRALGVAYLNGLWESIEKSACGR
ncbi:mannonate dehydratase [Caproicibacter sp.]|uniref:mannonate dehydratase n=1 Tax=Caproicibacter sp. TaxID=2814884 RepID=UPI003989DD21